MTFAKNKQIKVQYSEYVKGSVCWYRNFILEIVKQLIRKKQHFADKIVDYALAYYHVHDLMVFYN